MCIKPRCQQPLTLIVQGMGRQGDNRQMPAALLFLLANTPGDGITTQHRHLDIHQDKLIIIFFYYISYCIYFIYISHVIRVYYYIVIIFIYIKYFTIRSTTYG